MPLVFPLADWRAQNSKIKNPVDRKIPRRRNNATLVRRTLPLSSSTRSSPQRVRAGACHARSDGVTREALRRACAFVDGDVRVQPRARRREPLGARDHRRCQRRVPPQRQRHQHGQVQPRDVLPEGPVRAVPARRQPVLPVGRDHLALRRHLAHQAVHHLVAAVPGGGALDGEGGGGGLPGTSKITSRTRASPSASTACP